MTKITLRLDLRYKLKDNTYPLKIAIARGESGKTLYLPIGVYLHKENWNKEYQTIIGKDVPNKAVLVSYIRQKLLDIEEKLVKLQKNGSLRLYTDKELIAYMRRDDNIKEKHFLKTSYNQFITLKTNTSTKRIYDRTIALIGEFCDYNNLSFEDITVKWLNDFKVFLMKYCKSKNGEGIHFRNIRALFNFAIKQETINCYPFKQFCIEYQTTEKRSMSLKQLQSFFLLDVKPHQQQYKDAFVLSFLLIGINIVDLSQLREIKDDRIEYIRMKTGKPYSIKIESEALLFFKKYKGKNHLLSWFDNRKDYKSFANRCNYELGKIGKLIGIDNLTLYWARHTWATIAYELDIPDDTISRALGHSQTSGAHVTQVYIRTNYRKIDSANRKVINFVLGYNRTL